MKFLYQEERIRHILEYLKINDRVSIEEICDLYGVSRDTARRDLVKLEELGEIVRTRGGAILPTLQKSIPAYIDRLKRCPEEKRAIGKLAASLIKEGDKLILDNSTTVQACSEHIAIGHCTVITNSINQVDILSNKANVQTHLVGGIIDPGYRFTYGSSALEMIASYYVDKAIIGGIGISEKGLTSVHEGEGYLVKQMIKQAEQVILLVDHTKFSKKGFYKYGNLSDIDILITDRQPDADMMELLERHHVDVLIAKV